MKKPTPPTEAPSDLRIYALLTAGIFAAYAPVLRFGFVNYDDPVYIANNSYVSGGIAWSGIVWAFTHSFAGNWFPLTWISHMLDCQLFGLDAAGHHFTNLAIHTAATLLLFAVLRRITQARWPSAFVAGLFALHPLHVESVAWVAERKDVLSAFFWMLTLWAYARYVARPNPSRYLWTLVAFALGLMAKPMAVTLPLVLIPVSYTHLDVYKRQTSTWCAYSKAPCRKLRRYRPSRPRATPIWKPNSASTPSLTASAIGCLLYTSRCV